MLQEESSPDQNEPFTGESFEGESSVALDGKGRFAVPGRYRKQLDDRSRGQVVITLAFTPITALNPETEPFKRFRGLSILPLPVWQKFKSNLERRERFDPVRAAFSVFVASALACPIDGQGRILVPPALRDFLNRKELRQEDGRESGGKESEEKEGEGKESGKKDEPERLKLVGLSERFELWRETVWESVRVEMLAAAAERLKADQDAKRADPSSKVLDLPL